MNVSAQERKNRVADRFVDIFEKNDNGEVLELFPFPNYFILALKSNFRTFYY